MAYSDYGGYAYRNGERVEERSDYTIMPDGSGIGTPGAWGGFAAMAAGASHEDAMKFARNPQHHVVLGDGPILVGLHKQSSTILYRGAMALDNLEFLSPDCAEAVKSYEREGKTTRYIDSDWSITTGKPIVFNVDGFTVEVLYTNSDNYYQFARLTQPDGTVWMGFSGYGVGAGLEDADYGFSTDACEAELFEHWAAPSLQQGEEGAAS